jgi:predicted nucleotidyltransferase
MVDLFPDYKEFLRSLNLNSVRYLLLGGYAVNYHGYHRNTGDIDLWISVDEENARRVSQALQDIGFPADQVVPSVFLEVGAIYRFGVSPAIIEMLTKPTGLDFESCYSRRVIANLDGINVPIISLEDLKVNKKAAGRLKDLADLENLP